MFIQISKLFYYQEEAKAVLTLTREYPQHKFTVTFSCKVIFFFILLPESKQTILGNLIIVTVALILPLAFKFIFILILKNLYSVYAFKVIQLQNFLIIRMMLPVNSVFSLSSVSESQLMQVKNIMFDTSPKNQTKVSLNFQECCCWT